MGSWGAPGPTNLKHEKFSCAASQPSLGEPLRASPPPQLSMMNGFVVFQYWEEEAVLGTGRDFGDAHI